MNPLAKIALASFVFGFALVACDPGDPDSIMDPIPTTLPGGEDITWACPGYSDEWDIISGRTVAITPENFIANGCEVYDPEIHDPQPVPRGDCVLPSGHSCVWLPEDFSDDISLIAGYDEDIFYLRGWSEGWSAGFEEARQLASEDAADTGAGVFQDGLTQGAQQGAIDALTSPGVSIPTAPLESLTP